MTRRASRGAGSVAACALVMLLSLGVATTSATAPSVATDGITISGVDTSAYPEVTLELAAPAGATGGAIDAAAITVTENGASVAFTVDPVPTATLEVVLLIDTSGSLNGVAMTAAKGAVAGFLRVLPSEVPVGVVSFADHVSVTSPMTLDRAATIASINTLQPRGETSLYDALGFAPTLFSGAGADRQMVLLSDGGDTVSKGSLQQALAVTGTIRTSVISLNSAESNAAALDQIAAAGHGTLIQATDPAALEGLYQSVANSLVHRYRLHLTSTANGDTTYAVSIAAPKGALTATAQAALPAATALPATTAPASATPTTATSGNASESTVPVAGGAATGSPDSNGLLLVGGGLVFAAILLLALIVVPKQRRGRMFTGDVVAGAPSVAAPVETGFGTQVSDKVERALEGRGRRSGLAMDLDVANIRLRPGEFLVLVASAALTSAALLGLMLSWLGVIIGLVLAPLAASVLVNGRIDRRRRAFVEQLPDVMQLLVNSLRSGFGLPQALDAVANQVAEPARSEFQRVLFDVRIGRDPSDALAASALRMKSRDFDWVVAAMNINREVGGDLATILETVGETVRERLQLARQVRTLTAEGRLSAYILTALPFVLLGLLAVFNPGYYTPMKASPGPALVALGVVLLIIGSLWMRRLVKTQM